MKRLIPILGLLLLTACTSHAEEVLSLQGMKDCLKQSANTDYYGLERLHSDVQYCFFHLDKNVSVDAAHNDFYVCTFHMADPLVEMPPETTTFEYRDSIRRCISNYPGEHYVRGPQVRLLKQGDTFKVLLQDTGKEPVLLTCSWDPTPVGYAEDARCTQVK